MAHHGRVSGAHGYNGGFVILMEIENNITPQQLIPGIKARLPYGPKRVRGRNDLGIRGLMGLTPLLRRLAREWKVCARAE